MIEEILKEAQDKLHQIGTKAKVMIIPDSPYKSIPQITRAVEQVTGIPMAKMQGKSRKKEIVEARHIAMWFIDNYLGYTLEYTGEQFGMRDHTTVMHARDKIFGWIELNDERTLYLINEVNKVINEEHTTPREMAVQVGSIPGSDVRVYRNENHNKEAYNTSCLHADF